MTINADTPQDSTEPEHIHASLTAFQRDLLVVIETLGQPYGLAIKREIEDYYGKEVNHGRLYPNLDTLVEKGLIEKSARDRRTNEYEITAAGEKAIEHRLTWAEGGDE